jgi:hypothetical protein
MAYTKIIFENPNTGGIKEAPVGFSWTVFFFIDLSALVFMFIYNKLYIKDLIGKGFKAKSIEDGNIDTASAKIGMPIPMMIDS